MQNSQEPYSTFPVVLTESAYCSTAMQVVPDPPKEEWEPTKLTFRIRTGEDLWRVCHKSKWGRLTVPSIEFEIQADGQRHIDTLYNHIGNAVTNLAAHASSLPSGEPIYSIP